MIDLKHPWLELLVEHDVEAEQLEAAVRLLCLTTSVNVLQLWLHRYDRFDHDGLDFIPNLSRWPAYSCLTFLGRWLCHDSLETVI